MINVHFVKWFNRRKKRKNGGANGVEVEEGRDRICQRGLAGRIVARQLACLDRELAKHANETRSPMIKTGQIGETFPLTTGSPFAVGSATPGPGNNAAIWQSPASPEPIGEGVWLETVAAAGFSAWMLLAFGFVGWCWFPAGGVAISLLGISMSLLGLTSRLFKFSIVALALHVVALVACYAK